MSTLTSSLVVRLVDQVTAPARSVSRSLLGLSRAGGQGFGANLTDAIDRNNRALDRSRGRLFDAAAGFYLLKNALTSPVQSAMAFESAMADVNKVVDFESTAALEAFKNELIDLSKRVPISVNGLSAIAAAAGQAGIAGDDLVRFTEAAAKVGTAFDISADDTGEALAKLMTGLGLTIDEVVLLSDSMNHLSNSQASSAAEILDVVRRVGATATTYGYTAEQTAAFASAMIAAGAESQVAATSFRNMGRALTRGASATTRQKDALEALGLNATDTARRMQEDAVGTTVDVLEKISQLPAEMQAAVSSDLFGNEARALGPLLTNLDLVRSSLGLVADESEYAGSAFREFEVRAGTFENAVEIFNNRLTALKITIGNALIPVLTDLMATISPVIDQFAAFAAAHPDITRNVIGAAAAIIGFKIATAGLTFVGLIGRGGALAMLSLGFNTVGKAAIGAARGAKGMMAYQTALAAMSGTKLSGVGRFASALKGIALAIPGIAPLGGILTAVGGALAGMSAPVWLGIAAAVGAVAAAGGLIYKYWDRLSAIFGGVASRIGEELQPVMNAAAPHLRNFATLADGIGAGFKWAGDQISAFMDWVGSLFEREVLTDEQKARWGSAGYDAADQMITSVKDAIGGLINWFRDLPGKILEAIGSIDLGSLIRFPSAGQIASGIGGAIQSGVSGLMGGSEPDAHRAHGGPVYSGGDFLVGENEPEVFSPRSNGEVTPLSAIEAKIERMAAAIAGQGNQSQGAGPITFTGDFNFHNATDPIETARRVRDIIEDEVNFILRGSLSDTPVRS